MAEIEGETASSAGTSSSAAVWNEIREIKAELTRRVETIVIPIATLAPEPYELFRAIPVVVQPAGGEFIATFFDANISTAGDTQEEAVANLRSLLLDMFRISRVGAARSAWPRADTAVGGAARVLEANVECSRRTTLRRSPGS